MDEKPTPAEWALRGLNVWWPPKVDIENPQWPPLGRGPWGMDWRDHVEQQTRDAWPSLSVHERQLIYVAAEMTQFWRYQMLCERMGEDL